MTKDYPNPLRGGRASPKKPGSLGTAAALLEEQKRQLDKIQAELEAERARRRAEQRRFTTQERQLREASERERQQLANHLRSKWEVQRRRELRQLQEAVQREREAEIRQLLRWKDAEMRQLQQLLHRERDGVVRQARELQRQLAEELVNRGYCGRPGAPEVGAAQCRCRLQEVLAQLRWETDGEQAVRIRHLEAALDSERQLFLKYILEHFRWRPALSPTPDSQKEQPPEATGCRRPEPTCRQRPLRRGTHVRSHSLVLVPTARCGSSDGALPPRASSLDSLAPAQLCWLDGTQSRPKGSEPEEQISSLPDASVPSDPSHLPQLPPPPLPSPLPPSERRKTSDHQGGEGSRSRLCEALTPLLGLGYPALVKQNSELATALQVLARRCSVLSEENSHLRRAGFPEETEEKVKRLRAKNAKLTDLARLLEDRARKLRETNLRAVSAPVPGESSAALELCQAFERQCTRGLAEKESALQAKDKQIEELRQECHQLQARFVSILRSAPLPGGGAPGELDGLLRESQREVLRLQRQLTVQQGQGGARTEVGCQSAPCEDGWRQVQKLERELGALQRKCEELGAQVAAAQRKSDEAEAQLQAALREGAWLAKENARLQAQAYWVRKVKDDNSDVPRQLGSACQEREAAGLLAEQLLQQAAHWQDSQQQLQHYPQNALWHQQAAREEIRALKCGLQEATHFPKCQAMGSRRPQFQPGLQDQALSQPSTDRLTRDTSLPERQVALGEDWPLDSKPQDKRTSSNSSSEMESVQATVPSCPNPVFDTASEVDDLESDNVSLNLDMGGIEVPATTKLKIFLAHYNDNPFEGPNEHPERELPLTAGDYLCISGNTNEDGFYKAELEDSRQGLVRSAVVEQVLDSDISDCLPSKSPNPDPIPLPTRLVKASLDTSLSLLPGKTQAAGDRGSRSVVKVSSKTEVPMEISDAEIEVCQLSSLQSGGEQGVSRALPGASESFSVAPTKPELKSVTATSAEISWVCSTNSHPHVVYLNDQEHTLTPAGVNCYTFQSLRPATRYQASVEARLPWDLLQVHWETMSSTITFTTPLAGPPHPPLDVLVERHSSPGLLVVSWLPVTIDSAGSSNGVQVTGYAIYADGLKVAEVTDATAGNTVLDFSQLQVPVMCHKVSVRTMSLCGESLDSVPAQIPEDCFSRYPFLETSSFDYTLGDPAACRVAFPDYPEKPELALLSAKASSYTPGSFKELQAEFLGIFPEEPLRRWSLVPTLRSKGECPSLGAGNQVQRPREAWEICGKDPLFQESVQDHRQPLPGSHSAREENHYPDVETSKSPTPELVHPFPKCRSMKVSCHHQSSLEKTVRSKQDAQASNSAQQGPCQQYACECCEMSPEEEEPHFHAWSVEQQGQKEALRAQSGRGQALEDKQECHVHEPTSLLCPGVSSKVIKMYSRDGPTRLGQESDAPARVFVALFDYDPMAMSANPQAAEEELAFQKGQLLRVWGSRDSNGLYRGECGGQVGNIPGHLVAEVKVGVEWTNRRWHLPAQGPLSSVACPEDVGGLTGQQGSFPTAQGNPRRPPPWTPKTMMAALDYDPRHRQAGGRAKDKLALRAGDMVTVYRPVDDQGFYYGESGGHGHRGVVPAHLLDQTSFNVE